MKEKILDLFKENEIIENFSNLKRSFSSSSLISKSLLIASSFKKNKRNMLIVCNSLHSASLLYEYLSSFLQDKDLLTFFADETVQIEAFAESLEMSANRVYAMYSMLHEKEERILITHTSAYLRFLPQVETFKNNIKSISVGEELNRDKLVNYLMNVGYKPVSKVSTTLEFSKRGEVVDIYSVNYDNPIRIEFFDDEIDSIRFFDSETQKTIEKVNNVKIIPASELLIEDTTDVENVLKAQLKKDAPDSGTRYLHWHHRSRQ